jgi:hypothetical protein
MKYIRLFTGTNQQSHFEEKNVELLSAEVGKLSASIPVENLIFGELDDNDVLDWHNAPCKQYVIMLEGAMEIEIGDGTKKIFKMGDILLAEDIAGQGHRTTAAVKGKQRYMVVPLK